jgi:hypothetical protein
LKKGRWIPLLAGVIVVLLIAGIASASQASHHKNRPLAGPFCISRKTGIVRQVAPKKACRRGEIRKIGFAVKGLRGLAGTTGPQGPAGAAGAQGPAGATGATGASGLQGLPGPQGEVGPQGPVGPQGAQGVQGVQGDPGPQGLAGVPGISSITPVSADETCTSGGWLITDWQGNLYEICNGAAGPQGDQGVQGPQGDQGVQGPKGDQGDPGATGADGAPGVSAIQTVVCDNDASGVDVTTPDGVIRLCDGQVGPMGPTGATGDQGPQGDVGPQGVQGLQGDPGATGAQGPAGPTGPQGPTGATGAQGPAGTTAIYNAGGTSQTSAHIVEGTVLTNNGGNGSVTFAGTAAFTNGTSYVCTLTAENNGSPASSGTQISSKTGTALTFKSTLTSTTFDYVCVGN